MVVFDDLKRLARICRRFEEYGKNSVDALYINKTTYWKFQPVLPLTFTELVVLNVAPPVAALS